MDTKLFKEFEFVGACDSAVPVIMMMRLVRQVAAVFQNNINKQNVLCKTLPKITFMFLDGEEAFVDWVGDDNTYGSRHLANVYEKEGKIDSISLFMLLLLGGWIVVLTGLGWIGLAVYAFMAAIINLSVAAAGKQSLKDALLLFPERVAAMTFIYFRALKVRYGKRYTWKGRTVEVGG